ncbi:MAG: RNA ligase, Rnl2 family [Candidatus Hermodarchaeota archaeon]
MCCDTMFSFIKYSKIENSYQKDFIQKIQERGMANQQYVVEEKINGANLSLWITMSDLRVAKRTAFLTPDEKFFNYQRVVAKYQEQAKQLSTLSQNWAKEQDIGTIYLVVVYGELFGGYYPHPDVPPVPNAKQVAKGVAYSAENDYYAFDIRVTTTNGDHHYPDVYTRNQLLKEAGFFYPQPLFTGTLAECLAYPTAFESIIPQQLGLPPIKGNFCEGVVIKPVKTSFLPNGKRIILKNKNKKFQEKGKVKKRSDRSPQPIPTHLLKFVDIASQYITKTRYENLISKYGQFSTQEFGKLLGLYIKDLLEDFIEEHGEAFNALPKNERRQITRKLNKEVSKFLRSYLEEEKEEKINQKI